ncbi:TRAFAC clade GTPase domain-containing protein [Frankia sp. Cas3]|uniref:TRAFAC clade GTPase domain-containing protein n=1 Tax=Frankia sp. Cas3 TaxID=3073926 RepID=UPI002AD3AC47|nr:hypothetical protein [Frankia sp. Cas3]
MLSAAIVGLYLSFTLLAPFAFLGAAGLAASIFWIEFCVAAHTVYRGAGSIGNINILPPPPLASGEPQTREPAYRSYYFGPVFYDYFFVLRDASEQGQQRIFGGPTQSRNGGRLPPTPLLSRILETRQRPYPTPVRILGAGPFFGALAGIVIGFAVAAAVVALVSVFYLVVLTLTIAGSLLVAGVMRVIEHTMLGIRGITLECQTCHRRVTSPVYSCPSCRPETPGLHRKLVPGSLGVFHRLCRCGQILPTLLMGGKWKLPAYCNKCNQQLPVKGMTAPTFHVPVVAGRRAGKTVFMMSVMARMEARVRAGEKGFGFEFADQRAKEEFARARSALEAGSLQAIAATQAVARPRAYNVYVGPTGSTRRRLLYFYDAAGEKFEHKEVRGGLAGFHFLGFTHGIVFVIDPFAFPDVRSAAGTAVLSAVHPSVVEPEQVFGRVVQSLREHRRAKVDRHLNLAVAVTITKTDALVGLDDYPHPYETLVNTAGREPAREERSTAVRDWLITTAGQRSLVANIESTFGEHNYFAISALDAFVVQEHTSGRTGTKFRNDDPSDPVSWLLTTQGRRKKQ